MFAGYKIFLSKAFFLVAIAVGVTSAMAGEKEGVVKCGPGDECTTLVPNDALEAKRLCPNSPMQMSWSKKSDWTLLSCSCNCSEQSNKNWFVSRAGVVIGLDVGRYFQSSFFSQTLNPTVPDIMASHSMCKPADRKKIGQSAFLLLDKRPSNEKDPYCYDVIYAVDGGVDINFIENGAFLKKSDRDYFFAVDDSEKSDLRSLAKRISPSWSVEVDQTREKSLAVTAERAYLYDEPSPQGAGKAYLIDGDRVKVLGRANNGFLKFRYITKKGVVLEKWMKCEDVSYCD
ncbi:hypothetical protein [Burkholderia diffusa]|uniref:hypothetical protein n=1 Tax=Burkholderia diffusa TaxID=488732 RepID=UPI00157AD602|nr:hypothetical protein [Burkholderia diffusa]NTY41194.1 hypothetical protein [Burkholderia diffusa]